MQSGMTQTNGSPGFPGRFKTAKPDMLSGFVGFFIYQFFFFI